MTLSTNIVSANETWQSYGDERSPVYLQYPQGWTASSDAKTGRIDLKGSDAALSVLPFFMAERIPEPMQFFSSFLSLYDSGAKWTQPEKVGNVMRSMYTGANENVIAVMELIESANGSSGKLSIAKISKDSKPTQVDLLAKILETFKYNQVPATAALPQEQQPVPQANGEDDSDESTSSSPAPVETQKLPDTNVAYRTFTDPDENSFSVDVPAGWKVEGGMTSVSAIDKRPWVKVSSPDNLMMAFIGDGQIPPFSIPNAQLSALGFHEGRNYMGGVVRSYVPARAFAEKYARTKLKSVISNLSVVEEHDQPEVARQYNGTVGATRSEAASIKMTGMYGNIPAVAYFLASTKATVMQGTGAWWVTLIAGQLGPADRDQQGLSIILHMLQTFQINPEWKARSVATTGQISRNYRAASQQKSQAIMNNYWNQQAANENIHSAYWNRQASQDRAANKFSDAFRGVENVEDPRTGTKYQVQYGPNYHWIDPSGNYAGTEHSAPGPEWRQLLTVPQ